MIDDLGWVDLGVKPDADGFGTSLSRQIEPDLDQVGSRAGKRFSAGFKKVAVAGIGAGLVAGAGAIRFASASLGEADEARKVGAQTEAVIESTGKAAKVSAGEVAELAGRLSNMAAIDDELIQSGANVLLTFTKVRNEAGAGNKVFDQAAKAALNMSVALGKDLSGSATQVGKALNDPVKGVTALAKAGVQFSEDQKATIKRLVETGDTLGAQKIILRELDTQFAGSAKSQATESDKLKVAYGNLTEEIGTALLPYMDDLARFIRKDGIPAVRDLAGWVESDGVPAFKKVAKFAKNAGETVGDLIGFLDDLPDPAKYAGLVALIGGIGAVKLRGGGKGALGTAGSALGLTKPVPVLVTNPGFGSGGLNGLDGPGGAVGGKWATLGKAFGAAAGVAILAAAVKNVDTGLNDAVRRHPNSKPEDFGISNEGYVDFSRPSGAFPDWFAENITNAQDMSASLQGLDDRFARVGDKSREAMEDVNDFTGKLRGGKRESDRLSGALDRLAEKRVAPQVDTSSIERAIGLLAQVTSLGLNPLAGAVASGAVPLGGDESPRRAGVTIDQRGSTIVAHDYNDFVSQTQKKAQQAALGGRPVVVP